ncbi:unnamed protein product [Amoebophrya sp. A120]|nr:unnamed protein product [Amoebophrya sp. A120]|eukprot:GSA120T00000676001.1
MGAALSKAIFRLGATAAGVGVIQELQPVTAVQTGGLLGFSGDGDFLGFPNRSGPHDGGAVSEEEGPGLEVVPAVEEVSGQNVVVQEDEHSLGDESTSTFLSSGSADRYPLLTETAPALTSEAAALQARKLQPHTLTLWKGFLQAVGELFFNSYSGTQPNNALLPDFCTGFHSADGGAAETEPRQPHLNGGEELPPSSYATIKRNYEVEEQGNPRAAGMLNKLSRILPKSVEPFLAQIRLWWESRLSAERVAEKTSALALLGKRLRLEKPKEETSLAGADWLGHEWETTQKLREQHEEDKHSDGSSIDTRSEDQKKEKELRDFKNDLDAFAARIRNGQEQLPEQLEYLSLLEPPPSNTVFVKEASSSTFAEEELVAKAYEVFRQISETKPFSFSWKTLFGFDFVHYLRKRDLVKKAIPIFDGVCERFAALEKERREKERRQEEKRQEELIQEQQTRKERQQAEKEQRELKQTDPVQWRASTGNNGMKLVPAGLRLGTGHLGW